MLSISPKYDKAANKSGVKIRKGKANCKINLLATFWCFLFSTLKHKFFKKLLHKNKTLHKYLT